MPDLYQELCKLADSDMYPFHMPGHKRNLEGTPMKGAFRCDITEIDDFDNLHDANGIIQEAQKNANELYGADETFFLVNGSTSGVLSALSAVVGENETALAARGSHKSFYHAAYLRHLNVRYLPYKIDTAYDIPDVYSAEDVEDILNEAAGARNNKEDYSSYDEKCNGYKEDCSSYKENCDWYQEDNNSYKENCDGYQENSNGRIKAVFITSPTYEGKCSDIRGIAEVCHRFGIPLIVDAAHGAHFLSEKNGQKDGGASKYISIPENAVSQGADIVIHSVHKTLPSMTQTALLHVQGKLVDRDRLRRFLRIYQSSSPSYVLMASIDLCIKEMQENKEAYIKKLLEYRNRIQRGTSKCRFIKVPGENVIADAAKVLISVKNATMTGQELYDILREEYKLQLEMAGETYVLAIITGWDKEEGIDRLIKAICEIDERIIADNSETNVVPGKSESKKNLESIDSIAISESEKDTLNSDLERKSVLVMELPEKKLPLATAWDAENEKVSIYEAGGRIAGEFINLYPPGIPIIVPGEVISEGVIAKIDSFLGDGLNVQGISDRKEVICVRQK